MNQQPMDPQQQAQARARVEGMKRQFEQKRAIADSLSQIKQKVGVYSGKGGVGKTTVAVNLAVTLAAEGANVGLLDVDIDCPNVVRVLNISELPTQGQDNKMVPPERFNVRVMSMGFFQENEEEAIIWRGPMVHNAINQFLQSTEWGELDYLIIDLPPGTSDAPLTIMQALDLDGFVVVTTPQQLAMIDAKRSINMIRKLHVNVLGVVENFSGAIFGSGGGEQLAADMDLNFLGRLEMRGDYLDTSKPTVLNSNTVLKEFQSIVEGMKAGLEAVEVEAD
ncbi:MAG: Mrp/NBP35 family ATP-binding protein [SAR202 cluster bacterium]|jgi:ATP-binding protein involved in chromosome partitioning|nr:Mrp/NBP35 family ATP-binding protein [SAR202 cluster bacterium]MDP6512677.1 Mrp/NBP35 family ATP-binding protein [SAR202 cluster bacterium]MDP6715682.1 Mrp/NBP35 family ATP-binding protein [SAR202 cluster bacterium]